MRTRLAISILTLFALLCGLTTAPARAGEAPLAPVPALDFTYVKRLHPEDINRTNQQGEAEPWGVNNWNCTPAHSTPCRWC